MAPSNNETRDGLGSSGDKKLIGRSKSSHGYRTPLAERKSLDQVRVGESTVKVPPRRTWSLGSLSTTSSGVPENVLQRFNVVKKIAKGEMGKVLLSYDVETQSHVALKLLRSRGMRSTLVNELKVFLSVPKENRCHLVGLHGMLLRSEGPETDEISPDDYRCDLTPLPLRRKLSRAKLKRYAEGVVKKVTRSPTHICGDYTVVQELESNPQMLEIVSNRIYGLVFDACQGDLTKDYPFFIKPAVSGLKAIFQDMKSMSQSLSSLHEANIVHFDIKPRNFLRAPDGKIKVGDLGMAIRNPFTVNSPAYKQRLHASYYRGSKGYAAPELVVHDDSRLHVGAIDVYGLGVVFVQMLEQFIDEEDSKLLINRIPDAIDGTAKLSSKLRGLNGSFRDAYDNDMDTLKGTVESNVREHTRVMPGYLKSIRHQGLKKLIQHMMHADLQKRPTAAQVSRQLDQLIDEAPR